MFKFNDLQATLIDIAGVNFRGDADGHTPLCACGDEYIELGEGSCWVCLQTADCDADVFADSEWIATRESA